MNNVLFIELIPKRLYEVTFPEEIEENTLSPPKEIPLSVEGGRGIPEKREGTTSKAAGLSLKGETNTKNTIEITNKDYLSINQGEADTDQMDMIEIYTRGSWIWQYENGAQGFCSQRGKRGAVGSDSVRIQRKRIRNRRRA